MLDKETDGFVTFIINQSNNQNYVFILMINNNHDAPALIKLGQGYDKIHGETLFMALMLAAGAPIRIGSW